MNQRMNFNETLRKYLLDVHLKLKSNLFKMATTATLENKHFYISVISTDTELNFDVMFAERHPFYTF